VFPILKMLMLLLIHYKTVEYTDKTTLYMYMRTAIQRRGSILAWIVILSVYGADTIAEVKLLISPFLH
jgi:hypothetical protein